MQATTNEQANRPLTHEERYARYGGWLQTHTGKTFFFGDMQPEDICIEDIAHALSNSCRFAGHCDHFYSIAQHCVHVADILEPFGRIVQLAGLLHDGTEAYLGDVTRPLKQLLPAYKEMENRLEEIIEQKFGVLIASDPRIKWADNVALMTEARDLLGPQAAGWGVNEVPASFRITPWTPTEAKRQFLSFFNQLDVIDV